MIETINYTAEDIGFLDDFDDDETKRLLWNMEVLREQVGDVQVVGGIEYSDTNEFPGVAVIAPGYSVEQVHTIIDKLQHTRRMDQGAVYLHEDAVFFDARGRLLRGGGDPQAERRRGNAARRRMQRDKVRLKHGLSIETIYPRGDCVVPDSDDYHVFRRSQGDSGAAANDDRARRSSLTRPSDGPPLPGWVPFAVGAAGVAIAGAGFYYGMRALRDKDPAK